jgi:hypothetical protein
MGQNFSGTYTSTINLTNPATQNPATITATGLVMVAKGDAVFGSGFAWNVINLGTVESLGTYRTNAGIYLKSGGASPMARRLQRRR